MKSIASRLLLSSFVVISLSLAVAGWIISLTFEDSIKSDMDKRLRVMLDTMIGVTEFDEDGLIRFSRPVLDQRFDEPLSGFYWQISVNDQPDFRSRSLWDQELSPDMSERMITGRFSMQQGPEGQQLRVLEQDIILPESEEIFRYIVALDTIEIDQSIERFDSVLNWALLVIGITILLSVAAQSYLILQPLRDIGRRLKDVRAGRRDRIEGEFPKEINPLAKEINALLDHNETVLTRARTHVGNLAHALKTPLSVIGNLKKEDDTDIQLSDLVDTMQGHIDHHLKRARVSGRLKGTGVPLKPVLEKLTGAMEIIFKEKQPKFHISGTLDLIFAGEEEDLNEMLGNLLENACKYGGNEIYIRLDQVVRDMGDDNERTFFGLTVEDNGRGVGESQLGQIFERGKRLDSKEKGSGLGLAIITDITEIYGGKVQAYQSDHGGLAVKVKLPALNIHD